MSADISSISDHLQKRTDSGTLYVDPQLRLYEDAIEDIADRLLLLRLQLRRLQDLKHKSG